MKCKECPAGKRITSRRIECIQYGMILLEDHECTREGWKYFEPIHDQSDEGGDGSGLHEDGTGAA